MKDKRLVIRLKKKDADAFRELYHKYIHRLYTFVLRTAKSPELTEDVLHDVFVKIWENRDKLDPEQSFQAYLFTVARNHLLNLLKRQTHESAILEEILRHTKPVQNYTEEQILYNESKRLFFEAVEQLPARRKEIFELCHRKGFTYEKTANQLGISLSTVNSQMVKARKFIREYLTRMSAISEPDDQPGVSRI